jgi:hypothetical protein
MQKKLKRITPSVLSKTLDMPMSEITRDRLNAYCLLYTDITDQERDDYISEVIDALLGDIPVSGKERIDDWERGWKENLSLFVNNHNPNSLIPKYHGKSKLVHWMQKIVVPMTPNFDYLIHQIIVDMVIETYLKNMAAVFEFGCGACNNLFRIAAINKTAQIIGLDWAETSQRIISEINYHLEYRWIGKNFNFFNPDYNMFIPPSSGFLTIAALEQVGDKFEPFLDYCITLKPSICVHIEPIAELLDETNLIDKLSILYFKKRNYLNGFLTRLRELEKDGIVEIIKQQRTYTGSFFIEGHSIIVWRPCNN